MIRAQDGCAIDTDHLAHRERKVCTVDDLTEKPVTQPLILHDPKNLITGTSGNPSGEVPVRQ